MGRNIPGRLLQKFSVRISPPSKVRQGMPLLSIASSNFIIRIVGVPDHIGIAANCKVDKLAREDILVSIISDWERAGFPLFLVF